jgi:arsenate reductase
VAGEVLHGRVASFAWDLGSRFFATRWPIKIPIFSADRCGDLMASESRDLGRKKILFLCARNSARSQMAEGLLRSMFGDKYEAYSAGVIATSVDPRAVKVMAEIGIDITGQRSKASEEFHDTVFSLAVTVCDRARQACSICSAQLDLSTAYPKAKEVIHRSFEDPAAATGREEEQLEAFRRVRDEIKDWIIETFGS